MTSIIIVDDHPLFRGAMAQALGNESDGDTTIKEAGDFAGLQRHLDEEPDTDLVLLDLAMPGVSGLTGLITLRADHPAVPVIVVSASDDGATINRAMSLGASGFVSKSASVDSIREAINVVLDGGIWRPAEADMSEADAEISDLLKRLSTLTPQQTRVLSMISQGLLNKQIAYELDVSEATVKAHVSAVLQKLNVDSRTQAVIVLSKLGSDGLSLP